MLINLVEYCAVAFFVRRAIRALSPRAVSMLGWAVALVVLVFIFYPYNGAFIAHPQNHLY